MPDRRFTRAARVRSASYDETENTVELVWTTGATVRRSDPWTGEEFDEVLSLEPGAVRLDRLNAGAPFLDTHNSSELGRVLGAVVPGSATVEGGRGLATVKLSRAPTDRDTVQKIADGIIRNVSVGYFVHAFDVTDDGEGVPTHTATDWEPVEISAVPVPADAGAQIRSLPSRGHGGTSGRAANIRRWAAKAGMRGLGEEHVRSGTSSAEFFNIVASQLAGDVASQGGDMSGTDRAGFSQAAYEAGKREMEAITRRHGIGALKGLGTVTSREQGLTAEQRTSLHKQERGAREMRRLLGNE